jgi:hypothetical protein
MKIALLTCCCALAPAGLSAAVTPVSALEVKIELRVLDFVAEPADRSVVAVLYDREQAGSTGEAAAILDALRQVAGLARSEIAPRLVEIRSLGRMRELKAVILTAGLDDEAVLKYGIAHQTLVLSAGTGCVRDHRCMVGVTAVPDVEIGVNSPAIRDGHIRFADGFQLMVKEY